LANAGDSDYGLLTQRMNLEPQKYFSPSVEEALEKVILSNIVLHVSQQMLSKYLK